MTKDYRSPPPARRRRDARRGSCAFWFLFGGLIGAFGVGYAWMIHEPDTGEPHNEQATTRPPSKPPQAPTYDFFSSLPEEEVVVPAQESDAPPALPPAASQPAPSASPQPPKTTSAPKPEPAPGTATDARSGYLLQLGSFRSAEDAERLKAQLALKSVQTRIQSVTLDSGQTYHRVRTATYDKAQAQALRARLEGEGQESIMIRVR
jgi:cell division protein FtsN